MLNLVIMVLSVMLLFITLRLLFVVVHPNLSVGEDISSRIYSTSLILLLVLEQNTNEGNFNRFLGDINAKLEVLPGLIVGGRYSQQRTNQIFGSFTSKQSRGQGADRNGFANRSSQQFINQLAEMTAAYDTDFGDLDFSALLGYSYQQFDNEGFARK